MEVFALSGDKSENPAQSPYWATRLALSQSMKDAAAYLARKGTVEKSVPALAKLVGPLGRDSVS